MRSINSGTFARPPNVVRLTHGRASEYVIAGTVLTSDRRTGRAMIARAADRLYVLANAAQFDYMAA
jgi:hypothetical protein